VSGSDRLVFDDAVFAAAGLSVGQISSSQFWASTTATAAHDADDRFVYNTKSGVLYFDVDGSGGNASVAVALLGSTTHPVITYTNIVVI
jgi:Ca2+-binding RTX toxin-like protein